MHNQTRFYFLLVVLVGFSLASGVAVAQTLEEGIRLFQESILVLQSETDADSKRRALEKFGRSKEVFDSLNAGRHQGWWLFEGAEMLHRGGKKKRACKEFEKALNKLDKVLDRERVIRASRCCGRYYVRTNKHDEAIVHLTRVIELESKQAVPSELITDWIDLGIAYTATGHYEKAFLYYEKAIRAAGEAKLWPKQVNAQHNLAVAYKTAGLAQEALERFQRAAELAEREGLVDDEGQARLEECKTLRNYGKHEDAVERTQDYFKRYEGTPVLEFQFSNLLGNIHLDQGNSDKADKFLKDSPFLIDQARLALHKKRYEDAASAFNRLRQSAERSRSLYNLFSSLCGLGIIAEETEDFKLAEEHYTAARDVAESIRLTIRGADRARFFSARINGFHRTVPYKGLARVLYRSGTSWSSSLFATEYLKTRYFVEAVLGGHQAPAYVKRLRDGQAEIFDKYFQMKRSLISAQAELGRLQQEQEDNPQPSRQAQIKGYINFIETWEPALKHQMEVYERGLHGIAPGLAAGILAKPVRLRDARLPLDRWYILYDVSESGILSFLVKDNKVLHADFRSIPLEELCSKIDSYVNSINEKNSEGFTGFRLKFLLGHDLYNLLLSDLLKFVPKTEARPVLTIIPDGCLADLPFEALVVHNAGKFENDKGWPRIEGKPFLFDHYDVLYAQSLTSIHTLHTLPRPSIGSKLLVLADPRFSEEESECDEVENGRASGSVPLYGPHENGPTNFLGEAFNPWLGDITMGSEGSGWPRLCATRDLPERLKTAFPDLVSLTREEANKQRLLEWLRANNNDFGYIIFATHGAITETIPFVQRPVLILADTGEPKDFYLQIPEVVKLDIRAKTVALSACRTGQGEDLAGEGTMSFGRAFLQSGARSVLMSLWNVQSESTSRLVQQYMVNCKNPNLRPLQALRKARENLRYSKEYQHPVFWASFILLGDLDVENEDGREETRTDDTDESTN